MLLFLACCFLAVLDTVNAAVLGNLRPTDVAKQILLQDALDANVCGIEAVAMGC